LSFRIDALVGEFPISRPDHLKIDVDGLEAKVIEGARQTLASGKVRSIIVELREDRNGAEITDALASFGFRLHSKQARWTEGLFNYVFSR